MVSLCFPIKTLVNHRKSHGISQVQTTKSQRFPSFSLVMPGVINGCATSNSGRGAGAARRGVPLRSPLAERRGVVARGAELPQRGALEERGRELLLSLGAWDPGAGW